MRRFGWVVMLAALLAGCGLPKQASESIGTGRVLALSGVEGRWGGAVTPADPAACGPERHGLMTVGGEKFAFDPFGSTTVISGTVQGDTLRGTLTRVGGEHQTLSIGFEGHAGRAADGTKSIDGTLISGKCSWRVALRRA